MPGTREAPVNFDEAMETEVVRRYTQQSQGGHGCKGDAGSDEPSFLIH